MYHRSGHFQKHHLLGKASSRKENVGLELFHLDLLIPALAITRVSVSEMRNHHGAGLSGKTFMLVFK